MANSIGALLKPVIHLKLPPDWHYRLARSAELTAQGLECVMCGGTGGWPGIQNFVKCNVCRGSGAKEATQ